MWYYWRTIHDASTLCLCADADAVASAAAADADDNNGGAADASTLSKDCKDWTTTIHCCVRGQTPR